MYNFPHFQYQYVLWTKILDPLAWGFSHKTLIYWINYFTLEASLDHHLSKPDKILHFPFVHSGMSLAFPDGRTPAFPSILHHHKTKVMLLVSEERNQCPKNSTIFHDEDLIPLFTATLIDHCAGIFSISWWADTSVPIDPALSQWWTKSMSKNTKRWWWIDDRCLFFPCPTAPD